MQKDFISTLPKELVSNALGVCGPGGRPWLLGIPRIISDCQRLWNIIADDHFPELTYNYVAPAVMDSGKRVVIKIGLPVDEPEIYGEADYLRVLNGDGVVRLLAEDRRTRSILLERLDPGDSLKTVFANDPRLAVAAAIETLKRIVRRPPIDHPGFVKLSSWVAKMREPGHPSFPRKCVDKALEIFDSSHEADMLLIHGDFHHTNILSAGSNSFLAIDPKGVIGDIKYDIAVFLQNHHRWLLPRPDGEAEVSYAVAAFAGSFNFTLRDIRRWAYAGAILSTYWTFVEGDDSWRKALALADFWDV